MSQLQILLPCVALVALTAIVWIRLYVERIGEMRARRITTGRFRSIPNPYIERDVIKLRLSAP